MKIILAKHYGLCFGVKRALKLAKIKAKSLNENKSSKVFTLGPIIHNPQAVEFLKNYNIIPLEKDMEKSLVNYNKNDISLVIRSHGIPEILEQKLILDGYKLVDATCPFVKKAQNIAQDLKKRDMFSLIIGDEKHPEVIGIKSYASDKVIIVNTLSELIEKFEYNFLGLKDQKKIGLLSQTTQSLEKFKEIVNFLESKNIEVEKYNTICFATLERQNEANQIAKDVDIVFVIGGKNSSNTDKLFEICKKVNDQTFHIEQDIDIDEILMDKKNEFENILKKKVGLVTGASTPSLIIRKVINKLRRLNNG